MPTRMTPAALDGRIRDTRDDDEATFEPLRHVRHEAKRNPKKRRILERAQLQNAKNRRTA